MPFRGVDRMEFVVRAFEVAGVGGTRHRIDHCHGSRYHA